MKTVVNIKVKSKMVRDKAWVFTLLLREIFLLVHGKMDPWKEQDTITSLMDKVMKARSFRESSKAMAVTITKIEIFIKESGKMTTKKAKENSFVNQLRNYTKGISKTISKKVRELYSTQMARNLKAISSTTIKMAKVIS